MASDYSFLLSNMVWSHSRLTTFEDCPYKFFLSYIKPEVSMPLFFSGFGSLVHDLLAGYYSGSINKNDLAVKYLSKYRSSVIGKAPSQLVRQNYLAQGLSAMRNPYDPDGDILAVEHSFEFRVGNAPFVGVADLIFRDERYGVCIMDHKSRDLKQRSGRKKPTKSDSLLDKYFRQLYLYAAAYESLHGVYPDHLCFNCFRTGTQIFEPFNHSALVDSQDWALGIIKEIQSEQNWYPSCDSFKCRYICGFHNACAYYQMSGGDKH